MSVDKRVSIILPSYNEATALPLLVEKIQAVFEKSLREVEYQIVIVDDDSPDGTAEIIQKKFGSDSKIKLIVRKGERGLGTAVLRGIRETDYFYVLVMDCDFNHPPEKIIELVKMIDNYDIVCYSRYIKGGGMNTENKLFRFWGSRLFNKLIQLYLGLKTKDNLSGFFIARKVDLLILPVDIIFAGYGEFYFGILYFMLRQNPQLKILELPIVYQQRIGGTSKTKFMKLMRQYWQKAKLFKKYYNEKGSHHVRPK
jgi:dolichol-phosphate mannosyltransferase